MAQVPALKKRKRMKKELGLFDVFAVAMGTTLSSGFFLLPGLAAVEAGSAVVISYLLAALLVVPPMFSMVELATAMPRAGGAYYFIDRSLGPLAGTVGGLGTWVVLVFKSAFALIGMGAYLGLLWEEIPLTLIAGVLAIVFGLVNLIGAKKTGVFQGFLVLGLILILLWFCGVGLFHVNMAHFRNIFAQDVGAILSVAGMVYISYAGLTKVTSIAEEVRNPETNLSRGMFLALGAAVAIYGLGTFVMVGVLSPEGLAGDLTPVATTAQRLVGAWGMYLIVLAAILAFFAAANAGILSASRYPMAMARDHLLPSFWARLNSRGIPAYAIYLTVVSIIGVLVLFDPAKIAKLASAFQLLLFAFLCLAVIVMRESHIESYDPGYQSPFYPWMQIVGALTCIWMIGEIGWMATAFSSGLVVLGVLWYFFYARERVIRQGAIYHVFSRLGEFFLELGEHKYEGLDIEFREILKEKGIRKEDPFEEVVAKADVLDLKGMVSFEDVVRQVSIRLARRIGRPHSELAELFLEGTRLGATPVSQGVALPHLRLKHLKRPYLVIVRLQDGMKVSIAGFPGEEPEMVGPIYAAFFLVSPDEDPRQHLRMLAQIAERVDEEDFLERWLGAKDELELKRILLGHDRFLLITVGKDGGSREWVGRSIRELGLPEGVLIALVRRGGRMVVPRGSTVLAEGDVLTLVGEPPAIQALREQLALKEAV